MALSSISISIENNPYKGYIDITSNRNVSSLGNIAYIHIFHRQYNVSQSYQKIYEIKVETLDDLDFIIHDYTCVAGLHYQYYIEVADGNQAGYTVLENETISNVECYFEGLYIGNDTSQYMAHLNCSTDIARNTQINYVNTLSGRTPYRVSNNNLNYTTGHSSGLFLQLDENGNIISERNSSYEKEVIDFLTDGTSKIIKTSNGGMWYVSIDQEVDMSDDDKYAGMNLISFSWTEIGDVPVLRTVT